MASPFDGRDTVITGAVSGIRLATALALMAAGAAMVMVDRTEAALAALVDTSGGKASA